MHLALLSLDPSMPALVFKQQGKLNGIVAKDPTPLLWSCSLSALIDLKECPEAEQSFFATLESIFSTIGAELTDWVRKRLEDPSLFAGESCQWDDINASSGSESGSQ